MKNSKAIVTSPLRCVRPRKDDIVFEGQILMINMDYEDGTHVGPIERNDFVKILKITKTSRLKDHYGTNAPKEFEVHCRVLFAFGVTAGSMNLEEYVIPMSELIRKGYTLKPRVWRLLKCLHG